MFDESPILSRETSTCRSDDNGPIEEYVELEKFYSSQTFTKEQIFLFMSFKDPVTKILNKEAILKEAKKPQSILHPMLRGWDKDYAQEKYLMFELGLLEKRIQVLYVQVIHKEKKKYDVQVEILPKEEKDKTPEVNALMGAFSPRGKALGKMEAEDMADDIHQPLLHLQHCLLSARGIIGKAIVKNEFFDKNVPMDDLIHLIDEKIELIRVKLSTK